MRRIAQSFGRLAIAAVSISICLPFATPRVAVALTENVNPHVPQTNGPVYALVQAGDRVYVGGEFTNIGGVDRNHLAAFDATTGQVDMAWNPDVGSLFFMTSVRTLSVDGGKVYAGGYFTTVNGGIARSGLAAFEPANGSNSGAVDAAWNPDLAFNPVVNTLLAHQGKVYAGGRFLAVNGSMPRAGLAAFEPANGVNTGLADPAWVPLQGASNASIEALAASGNRVYAAGKVTSSTLQPSQLLAVETANGGNVGQFDAAWRPVVWGPLNLVYALLIHNNRLYVGGNFAGLQESASGDVVDRYKLAALNLADGSTPAQIDPVWNPWIEGGERVILHVAPLPGEVDDLAIVEGHVVAVGRFDTVNGGTPRKGMAAFLQAGWLGIAIPYWGPNLDIGPDDLNAAFAVCPSGAGMLVGGSFSTVDGMARNNLVGFGSTVVGFPSRARSWSSFR